MIRVRMAAALVVTAISSVVMTAQQVPVSPIATAIDQLVSFDFAIRTEAARTLRRAPAGDVVPALAGAARQHSDSYVRYLALVLLAGFGDASAESTMRLLMGDPNDRLRAVIYGWFEHHPSREMLPTLVAALDREQSEFVRPALTRALVAAHREPAARAAVEPLILAGEDYFRGSVIDALGDYQVSWARAAIADVAKLDGPLQDDSILALGKIGDRASLPGLAVLQKTAGPETQTSLAAASCLITRECDAALDYLAKTLAFAADDPQHQPLLRSTAFALGALARRGERRALAILLTVGEPAGDPARAAIGLAVGHVALRNAGIILDVLETRTSVESAGDLLLDGFDMLSEDFEEEGFFVQIRKAYWAAPEGSARRRVAQALIDKLEF
ncbi:MAG: HEAT repeat domain-containing protein [Acidobacteria bacterium]|jgi:hypothetical protein|nr:HEAT repeat domain-containing protein [Acidobacteriota bacterium]